MGLNPFKDSNLDDLHNDADILFKKILNRFFNSIRNFFRAVIKKGNERITLMFIPHSEKRIINFHISNFAIVIFLTVTIATVTVTSTLIVNHASAVKVVSKLKSHGVDTNEQIKFFKKEISMVYDTFNEHLKTDFTYVYGSLSNVNDAKNLWAMGGASPENGKFTQYDELSPDREIDDLEQMETELLVMKEKMLEIKEIVEKRKKTIENTPSIWPANGYIISSFGKRKSEFSLQEEFSTGIDIYSYPGAEIKATAPGTVQSISWDSNYGLRIVIKHKYGFSTIYSHCQRVSVKEDQKVSKGETIGFVGKTGKVGSHICHYQIRIGTQFVDPMPYLNKISTTIKKPQSN